LIGLCCNTATAAALKKTLRSPRVNTVLMCYEHWNIPLLACALGVPPDKMPTNPEQHWPEGEFDRVYAVHLSRHDLSFLAIETDLREGFILHPPNQKNRPDDRWECHPPYPPPASPEGGQRQPAEAEEPQQRRPVAAAREIATPEASATPTASVSSPPPPPPPPPPPKKLGAIFGIPFWNPVG